MSKKKKKNEVNESVDESEARLSDTELEEFENILTVYAEDKPGEAAEEGDGEASDETEPQVSPSDDGKEKEKSPFLISIEDFTADDVSATTEKKKSVSGTIRTVILILCVAICTVSTFTLVRNVSDKVRGEKIYGDIIDSFADGFNFDGNVINEGGKLDLLANDIHAPFTPTMDEIIRNGIVEDSTPSDYSAELARMRASLESLRNINPEIYGWIKIPGTKINYPIAQAKNNEYYLDHAYTGDNLVNGSIFADFRCNPVVTMNYNTVLYGHNITDGSMFNNVTKFFDTEFFNNTYIYLYTFDGIYIFKAFSIHEAEYDSGYIAMGFTPEEFIKFATSMKDLSDVASDKTFTKNDRMITLSTCTNGIRTKRYALHGYLVQKITD